MAEQEQEEVSSKLCGCDGDLFWYLWSCFYRCVSRCWGVVDGFVRGSSGSGSHCSAVRVIMHTELCVAVGLRVERIRI